MLIGKFLLITMLFGSFSYRTPIIDQCPMDYEVAVGASGQVDIGKYEPKLNYDFQVLWERELGICGSGHDISLWYEKKDKLVSRLIKKKISNRREFSSYYRQVKDMSLQTIDTGYGNDYFLIGYTLSAEAYEDLQIMYYNRVSLGWLTASLRVNQNKTIIEGKAEKDFPIQKNVYLTPLFKYINISGREDIQAKIVLKYKVR